MFEIDGNGPSISRGHSVPAPIDDSETPGSSGGGIGDVNIFEDIYKSSSDL